MLAQSPHHLVGEAQSLFYISIGFGSVDPSIERTNVLDSGDICREFPADNLGKTTDYFRPGKR